MNTRKNLIGAFWLVAQPLFLNVLSIPATAYIIRVLGPLRYGQWAIGVSLIGTTMFLSNLGLRTLFIRSVARDPDSAESALAEQLGLRGSLAAAAGIVALAICWALRYPAIVLTCTAIAAFGLLLTVLAGILADLLQGLQLFSIYAGVSLLSGIVLTALSVIAMWERTGPVGLAVAYLSGPTTTLVVLAWVVGRRCCPLRVRWSLPAYRALLSHARVLGAQQFLGTIQERVEQILVPKLVGIAAFGVFSAGTLLTTRMTYVPDGLATAFYPAISRSCQENPETSVRLVRRLMVLSLAVCIPIAVLMIFLSPAIAAFLFPHRSAACRLVMEITMASMPVMALVLPMSFSLQAAGQHSEAARAGMWATVLGSGASVLLIGRLGIVGACLSWIVRQSLLGICLLPRFRRAFPSVLPGVPLGRIVCGAGVMASLLWITRSDRLSPGVVAAAAGALAAYAAALVMFRVVGTADLGAIMKRSVARGSE